MLLKLFTAVIIISISKVFLCIHYYNNRYYFEYYITVAGKPWWNDTKIKETNVTLSNANGSIVYGTEKNVKNGTQFSFWKYKDENKEIEDYSVRLDYNCSETPKNLIKKVPDDCTNFDTQLDKDYERKLKFDDFYCNLGYIYLSC
uniref:Uncharacterized protein n=1 Tax=Strongyloides venezuelensis TaxID=75913 RepID=A0A0K0F1G3_STRVS